MSASVFWFLLFFFQKNISLFSYDILDQALEVQTFWELCILAHSLFAPSTWLHGMTLENFKISHELLWACVDWSLFYAKTIGCGEQFDKTIVCSNAAAEAARYGFTAVERPEGFLVLVKWQSSRTYLKYVIVAVSNLLYSAYFYVYASLRNALPETEFKIVGR